MKTLVIFDRKSGEILHTHLQTEDRQQTKGELLPRIRHGLHHDETDILEVESLEPGVGYRVDVKENKLVRVRDGKVSGIGGGGVQRLSADSGHVRTTVFDTKSRQVNKE